MGLGPYSIMSRTLFVSFLKTEEEVAKVRLLLALGVEMDWLFETSAAATWVLVITWCVGFVLTNYMLIGWYRILVYIKKVTREGNAAVSQALLFLWACVLSSLVFPLGALFCPAQWVLAAVSTVMCGLCVWTFVRFLALNKDRYVKLAILGEDFVSRFPLDELDYDDLLALGRRKRMEVMYEEFRRIQLSKISAKSEVVITINESDQHAGS